jgi:hypothetical protein
MAAPLSDSVSLRLRLFKALTSLVTVTRRLILQKARRHPLAEAPTCCGLMVSGSVSLPSPGFFSPFPRGTSALSVDMSCLALDRGRPGFRQGFSSLAVLRKSPHEGSMNVGYGALTRSGRPSHAVPLPRTFVTSRAPARSSKRFLQPPAGNGVHLDTGMGLGSSPFARRYLGNLCWFLFLQVLRWFSSLGLASHTYVFSVR